MSRPETGVLRDNAERVLGHAVGSKIERTYDQYAYKEAKGDALPALAALIERILAGPAPSNVVQMPARG